MGGCRYGCGDYCNCDIDRLQTAGQEDMQAADLYKQ